MLEDEVHELNRLEVIRAASDHAQVTLINNNSRNVKLFSKQRSKFQTHFGSRIIC